MALRLFGTLQELFEHMMLRIVCHFELARKMDGAPTDAGAEGQCIYLEILAIQWLMEDVPNLEGR